MKVLVTGSSGFIGSNLLKWLVENNFQVSGLDITSNPSLNNYEGKYRFVQADLNENDFYSQLETDYDVVYHLAAINGTANFYKMAYEVLVSGIRPTLNLLDWIDKLPKKPVFFLAGTSESYAGIFDFIEYAVPTNEQVPLVISDIFNARWSYAAAKIASEIAVVNFCRSRDIPWIIGRFHNIYGPGMSDKHFILDFAKRVKNGRLELFGWENTRSFMFIDHAVQALVQLVGNRDSYGKVVNIGTSRESTILEVANLILSHMKTQGSIELYNSPDGSVMRRCPDTKLLNSLVNLGEEIDLRVGIGRTLDVML